MFLQYCYKINFILEMEIINWISHHCTLAPDKWNRLSLKFMPLASSSKEPQTNTIPVLQISHRTLELAEQFGFFLQGWCTELAFLQGVHASPKAQSKRWRASDHDNHVWWWSTTDFLHASKSQNTVDQHTEYCSKSNFHRRLSTVTQCIFSFLWLALFDL